MRRHASAVERPPVLVSGAATLDGVAWHDALEVTWVDGLTARRLVGLLLSGATIPAPENAIACLRVLIAGCAGIQVVCSPSVNSSGVVCVACSTVLVGRGVDADSLTDVVARGVRSA